MSELRIGLVSIPVEENGFSDNLNAASAVLEERANDGIDLFVFGEAALTGLDIDNARIRGVPDTSEALRAVNRLTEDFSTSICTGFVEREADRYYLTHCLSSDGRLCGIQRKVFAGNPTRPHSFASGKEIRPIPFRGFYIVILACADWMLPETVMTAGRHEPGLILAPTDQYSWTPHNRSVLHKAGQSASFWLQAPLIAAFGSYAAPGAETGEVFSCLAFDNQGDELIKTSRQFGEITVHTIDVEIRKAQRKWGGFRDRKKYLDSVRPG